MPSWNASDGLLVWNDSVIQESTSRREFMGRRLVARASEASRQFSVNRYWTVDLSGLQLMAAQLTEIRAFENEIGFGTPFLVRLSTYCLLEDEVIGTHNTVSYSPTLLGEGTGSSDTFQICKRSSIQGRAPRIDPIYYPNYDYPPLKDLNGLDWTALPPLRVWGGAPVFNDLTRVWTGNDVTSSCTIDRNAGTVTVSGFDSWYVTGGFYWKMKLFSSIPVKPMGAGLYVVPDGVQMVEPFPEGGEVVG